MKNMKNVNHTVEETGTLASAGKDQAEPVLSRWLPGERVTRKSRNIR